MLLVALFCSGIVITATRFASQPAVLAVSDTKPVEWISIEEAEKRMAKEPRKILVDVYTDWCGWCKKMDKATFANPEVAAIISQKFYAVKFNAEGTDNIIFNNKVYKFDGRVHDLAKVFLNGRMAYPTVAYLNEKLEVITPVPGYYGPDEYKKILTYFGDNIYKKEPLEKYLAK